MIIFLWCFVINIGLWFNFYAHFAVSHERPLSKDWNFNKVDPKIRIYIHREKWTNY